MKYLYEICSGTSELRQPTGLGWTGLNCGVVLNIQASKRKNRVLLLLLISGLYSNVVLNWDSTASILIKKKPWGSTLSEYRCVILNNTTWLHFLNAEIISIYDAVFVCGWCSLITIADSTMNVVIEICIHGDACLKNTDFTLNASDYIKIM